VSGGNVTITGTSGIRSKSKIIISRSSGGPPILETPWKYDGLINPYKRLDFTLPVTSHEHVIAEADLPGGAVLWYRMRGEDPCGRTFYSGWNSFTTKETIGKYNKFAKYGYRRIGA
jgi:hypothetical protein